jgi:hypothetical protein
MIYGTRSSPPGIIGMLHWRQNARSGAVKTVMLACSDWRHIGGYLKSPSKNVTDQGLCGGDMSPPHGTRETRNIKSGSEKRINAAHVGDITSGAAETPL